MDGRYGLRCAESGQPASGLRPAGGGGPDRRGALQRRRWGRERGGGAATRAARRAGAALQPWGARDGDRSALGRASVLSHVSLAPPAASRRRLRGHTSRRRRDSWLVRDDEERAHTWVRWRRLWLSGWMSGPRRSPPSSPYVLVAAASRIWMARR